MDTEQQRHWQLYSWFRECPDPKNRSVQGDRMTTLFDHAWTSDKKMKPCPFCGKRNTFCSLTCTGRLFCEDHKPAWDAEVICHFCGARVHAYDSDKDQAAAKARAKWECRAGDDQ